MRIQVLKTIFFVMVFLIIARLWYWQILMSDDLVAKAERQRTSVNVIEADRGSILFADKSTLATTQSVFLVFAQPKVIADKEKVAKTLATTFWEDDNPDLIIDPKDKEDQINKDAGEILKTLSKDLFWVSLGRRVNIDLKDKIAKLNIKGIGFDSSTARFYPEGSSSAHLLGFVGSDMFGDQTGYFGLEGFYNGELKGRNGLSKNEKDAQGLPILIGDYLIKEPKSGKTLTLNIDRTVQHMVEDKLKKGIDKYGAKSASAVVMDPKTGNVIAMASYPSYDPANPSEKYSAFFKNPIIADSYEPGSTFKVLVMAAGINEHLVKPDTICDICDGPVNLGGFTIRTWDNKYEPNSTMADVIIHSDNTGMVFVSKKLGIDKMYKYIQNYGFGNVTGIDLQDEQSPAIRERSDWKEIDLATSSFGQGIAVTGMQMVKAVASIANKGKVMEPHIVSSITEEDQTGIKTDYKIKPRVISQPISEEAAKTVTEMMVNAVDKGEAQYYKKAGGVGNYKIAGKTGTAQIPVAGHYDPNKTIASFIGFAPANDPKFIMLVRYQEPKSSIFGADTAAPTFFDIAKNLFLYYNIAPSQ